MKILIEINDKDLPVIYQGLEGKTNLELFFNEQFVVNLMEKKSIHKCKIVEDKQEFDKQGLDGQLLVEYIQKIADDKVELGKILLENLQILP